MFSVHIPAGANSSSLLRILDTWEERAKGYPLHSRFGNVKYYFLNIFSKAHAVVPDFCLLPLLCNQDFLSLKSKTKTLRVSLNEHENKF